MSKDKFLKKAKEVHGDKYDYSKVEYINNRTKVCIICPEHGEFWQTPSNHLRGWEGCEECSKEYHRQKCKKEKNTFVNEAIEVHGDKYDYSKVEYLNNQTKVCIICPEHGEFWQTPKAHLRGQGCKKCSHSFWDKESFLKKAKEVHGNKYYYSKVEYKNSETKVCIICPEHGEFWQTPEHHVRGVDCPKCRKKKFQQTIAKKHIDKQYFFVEKANEIHGNRYDYSSVAYNGSNEKICIICPEHGEFYQTPHDHLDGHGCPKCGFRLSKGENEISSFLKKHLGDNEVLTQHTGILNGRQEIDIYIPSLKMAIEYDGVLWHSEKFREDKNYHLNKTQKCLEQGIKLIHIYEDEFIEHKDIVLNKLLHIIGRNNSPVIGSRLCNIQVITNKDAKIFLNKNHIQGFVPSTVYLGLLYNGDIMAVMSFTEEKKNYWNLTRFATNINYRIPGSATKLFNFFCKNYSYQEIKTFLDRRWNQEFENVYNKMGFQIDSIEKPDYQYIKQQKRYHKFNFRKNRLNKNYGLSLDMTEREMAEKLGYYRIWNCGLVKYIFKNENVI